MVLFYISFDINIDIDEQRVYILISEYVIFVFMFEEPIVRCNIILYIETDLLGQFQAHNGLMLDMRVGNISVLC